MTKAHSLRGARSREPLLFGLVFLIFFQLLSDFIEAVYAFGLMGTSIPPEIVSVLFLFSPLLLFLFHKRLPRWLIPVSGGVFILARMVEVYLDTRGRMLVAGLGVAAFMLLLPALLAGFRPGNESRSKAPGVGLMLALGLSLLFKSAGASVDLSIYGGYRWLGVILSLLAGYLLLLVFRSDARKGGHEPRAEAGSFWGVLSAGLGIASILLLLYFVFNSPNVLARWTGLSYPWVVLAESVGVLLTAWVWFGDARFMRSRTVLFIWNCFFGLALLLTILPRQLAFPAVEAGYPLAEPALSWVALLPPYLTLLSFPVLFLDMALLVRVLRERTPASGALAGSFSLVGLYLLAMVLAHVFTTVYDYIPVIGPFFRDKYWLVHLVPLAVLVLSVWLVERRRRHREPGGTVPMGWFMGLAGIALLSVVCAYGLSAKPAPPDGSSDNLRVLTFNIQQGYSADGAWNFDGQLDLIRAQEPDLVALQESDTNRIAGGNKDVVKYFADHLDMYSYYGPNPVTGTFGIALLSRYPIQNARTWYLYSVGEQVAVIEAQVELDGNVFNIFVNHLGNGGPLVQQQQFLSLASGQANVIAAGDYNFRPDTEQYRLTTVSLQDALLISALSDSEIDPGERIDYIFVSPDLRVQSVRYIGDSGSDHPALLADITW